MNRTKAQELARSMIRTFIHANEGRLTDEQVSQLGDMITEFHGLLNDVFAQNAYIECDDATWTQVGWTDGERFTSLSDHPDVPSPTWRPVYVKERVRER